MLFRNPSVVPFNVRALRQGLCEADYDACEAQFGVIGDRASVTANRSSSL